MIVGIGLDLIDVKRIAKNIENPRFLDKVFTKNEQEYLTERNMNAQTAAGIFAAKEAVSKALGTGIGLVKWTDIEILKRDSGQPVALLHNHALNIMTSLCGRHVLVSITHTGELAAAQAVIED